MSPCPDPERLQALLDERLSQEECQNLEAHLQGCRPCQDTLDGLTSPAQALLPLPPVTVATTLPIDPQAGPLRPPDAALWPDVPGYQVLKELGRGGMGVVYQARQLSLNRLVALKRISDQAYASPQVVARFRKEAEAVARLQHPNVVQIHEVGELDGKPFFSLEYLEGGSLAQKLNGTPQPARPAAELVETLARAVHAAHERGIVHRDLKPGNVLLTADGTPKIADFGLAKHLDEKAPQTQSGAVVGTPPYMAPEQAGGKTKGIGPAADTYALGAILYELLTGRPPFLGATTLETLWQVLSQEPVPPSRLQPKLSRDLETICLKCLQKDPRKRYATAAALAEDLRRFLAGQTIVARPVGLLGRSLRWCKRQPAAAALLAVILCSLTAITAVGLHSYTAVRGQFRESLRRQAEALGLARPPGWRDDALDALRQAAQIRPGTDLRDLAVQTLGSWELRVRSELALESGAPVAALAVSPDGNELAVAVGPAIQLRNYPQGNIRITLADGSASRITCLQYNPDGTRLVYGSAEGAVGLWERGQGNRPRSLGRHEGPVQAVAFGPGPNAVSSTDGDSVQVWDLSSGVRICREAIVLPAEPIMAPENGVKPRKMPDADHRPEPSRKMREAPPMPDGPRQKPPELPEKRSAQVGPRSFPPATLVASTKNSLVIVARDQYPPVKWHFVHGKLGQREELNLPPGLNSRLALSPDERYAVLILNQPWGGAWRMPPRGEFREGEKLKIMPNPVPEAIPRKMKEGEKLKPHSRPDTKLPGFNPVVAMLCTLQMVQSVEPMQPIQPVPTPQPASVELPGGLRQSFPEGLFGTPGGAAPAAGQLSAGSQSVGATVYTNAVGHARAIELATTDAGSLLAPAPNRVRRDESRRLAYVSSAFIYLYDLDQKGVVAQRPVLLGSVKALSVSSTGFLFVAGDTGIAGLYRLSSAELEPVAEWDAEAGGLQAAVGTPDGLEFVTARTERPVRCWQLNGTKLSSYFQFSRARLCQFGLDPIRQVLAIADLAENIKLHRVDTGVNVGIIERSPAHSLTWTPQGDGLFFIDSLSPRSARWSGATAGPCRRVDSAPVLQSAKTAGQSVSTLAVSPDGRWLVMGGGNPGRLVLGASTVGLLGASLGQGPLLAASALLPGRTNHPSVVVRRNSAPDYPYQTSFGPGEQGATSLAFDAQGRYLAWATRDGVVHIQKNGGDGEWGLVATLPRTGGRVNALCFGAAADLLAVAKDGRQVILWDVKNRVQSAVLEHNQEVLALASDPAGRYLASGGDDGTITLWDVRAKQALTKWKGHQAPLAELFFLPSQATLVSCAIYGEVRMWHLDRIRSALRELALDW